MSENHHTEEELEPAEVLNLYGLSRSADDLIAKIKAEALREAAASMRAHKDAGHWNLRDERDPENAAQSPDTWLEVRADRIEAGE